MMTSYFNLLKYAQTGIASPDMTYYDKMRASTLMGGVVKTLTGQPPLTFKADGTPLISWSMKGNGSQTGTPTPDNPVMPTFCGVRTGNLFDKNQTTGIVANKYINQSGNLITDVAYYLSYPIKLTIGETYTWSFTSSNALNGAPTVGFYDSEDNLLSVAIHNPCLHFSFTVPQGCAYIRASVYKRAAVHTFDPMLISGTIEQADNVPLPWYEPYGWKIPFENHGENLIDYTLSERGGIDASGNLVSSLNLWRSNVFYEIHGSIVLSFAKYSTLSQVRVNYYDENYSHISREEFDMISASGVSLVIPSNAVYFKWTLYAQNGTTITLDFVKQCYIMLSLGSTPKPYSPYLNATIPVYLGEVPTVRRIKKLVLDGTENWLVESGANGLFTLPNVAPKVQYADQLCSHFSLASSYIEFYNTDLKFAVINRPALVIHYNAKQTVAAFKQWLADEYAAGTPVTVWYVLATEQTGIVNEPLAKIGTYADELHSTDAAVTIPTIRGSNTLTVDTELQPSEMTITYKG